MCVGNGQHRELHGLPQSFPTRRSSDLVAESVTSPAPAMVTSASATVRPCASTLPAPCTVTRACAALPASTTLPEPERLRSSLRSEEHTSELQSLMRISYAVFCLK